MTLKKSWERKSLTYFHSLLTPITHTQALLHVLCVMPAMKNLGSDFFLYAYTFIYVYRERLKCEFDIRKFLALDESLFINQKLPFCYCFIEEWGEEKNDLFVRVWILLRCLNFSFLNQNQFISINLIVPLSWKYSHY